jgi:hypothetical protein
MRKLFRRIYYLLNRGRLEKELEEEMAAHRELMGAARRDAFGSTSQLREQTRDVWGWQWLDDFRQDVQHGSGALFVSAELPYPHWWRSPWLSGLRQPSSASSTAVSFVRFHTRMAIVWSLSA